MFNENELEENQSLSSYSITHNATIHLVNKINNQMKAIYINDPANADSLIPIPV